jgi:phage/plasmid-like protein (TIGR03299 family)
MAHEISVVNGQAEAAYALMPAWHGLGTVLEHAPDSATMIQAAHLDWQVHKAPLYANPDGNLIAVPDMFATMRGDTHAVLGVVSDRYNIVQNVEAFDFLDNLLKDGIMKYESAGALRGGRIVWVLARMPSVDIVADGDTLNRYILFTTAHDGSGAIYAAPTTVRVVCANTLRLATQDMTGIRHSTNVRERLNVAHNYISQLDGKFTDFRDHARRLADSHVDMFDPAIEAYLKELFPEPSKALLTIPSGKSKGIYEKKIGQVRLNMFHASNTLMAMRDSWWQAYNAVTLYYDHQRNYRSSTSTCQDERRMIATMMETASGSPAAEKEKAFSLALKYAGIND